MRASRAHIAGVGISGPDVKLDELAVTAATKALLDVGATWTDVDQCVVCFDGETRVSPAVFNVFGATGTAFAQVDNKAGLFTTAQFIRSGQKQCALMVGTDEGKFAVSIVLVSDLFLTSHAYLKDSAIQIKACSQVGRIRMRTSSASSSDLLRTSKAAVQTALRYASLSPRDVQLVAIAGTGETTKSTELDELAHTDRQRQPRSLGQVKGSKSGLTSLCGLVWQLRGWADSGSSTSVQNCLLSTIHGDDGTTTVFVLGRSDGSEAPKWASIENLRDGRERLGYNPAEEIRQVSQEDVAAVRADQVFAGDENARRLELPVKGGDRAALARL